jgi:hypothetical protein
MLFSIKMFKLRSTLLLFAFFSISFLSGTARSQENGPEPRYIRGIHVSSWMLGSPANRKKIESLVEKTELNTVVVDMKEVEGDVFVPGVKSADKMKSYTAAFPDVEKYLAKLKKSGVYTIARLTVFKDNIAARRRPEWGVKNPEGKLWTDSKGYTWLDPYNRGAWEYNIEIAKRAVELGFDEIQFDYIRFPTDGKIGGCRYTSAGIKTTAPGELLEFLRYAGDNLRPMGAKISIDVFGLTTTSSGDMGIGQKIVELTNLVDYVSPMVYPSHYYKGEYNLVDPNKEPYLTVYMSMNGAAKRLGGQARKLRPWLQDFSMGYKYGPKEVRAQMQAVYDNDIGSWMLWNSRCVYTAAALKEARFSNILEKSPIIPAQPLPKRPVEKPVTISTYTIIETPVIKLKDDLKAK